MTGCNATVCCNLTEMWQPTERHRKPLLPSTVTDLDVLEEASVLADLHNRYTEHGTCVVPLANGQCARQPVSAALAAFWWYKACLEWAAMYTSRRHRRATHPLRPPLSSCPHHPCNRAINRTISSRLYWSCLGCIAYIKAPLSGMTPIAVTLILLPTCSLQYDM